MRREIAQQATDQSWLYTKAAEARALAPALDEAWMRRELLAIAERIEHLATGMGQPDAAPHH
jgi:hypothetical protein